MSSSQSNRVRFSEGVDYALTPPNLHDSVRQHSTAHIEQYVATKKRQADEARAAYVASANMADKYFESAYGSSPTPRRRLRRLEGKGLSKSEVYNGSEPGRPYSLISSSSSPVDLNTAFAESPDTQNSSADSDTFDPLSPVHRKLPTTRLKQLEMERDIALRREVKQKRREKEMQRQQPLPLKPVIATSGPRKGIRKGADRTKQGESSRIDRGPRRLVQSAQTFSDVRTLLATVNSANCTSPLDIMNCMHV